MRTIFSGTLVVEYNLFENRNTVAWVDFGQPFNHVWFASAGLCAHSIFITSTHAQTPNICSLIEAFFLLNFLVELWIVHLITKAPLLLTFFFLVTCLIIFTMGWLNISYIFSPNWCVLYHFSGISTGMCVCL